MKIFGRERDSLRVKKWKAARAMFVDGNGTEEVHITLLTDDGQKLVLQVPHREVPTLIGQLTDSYEAINVPLYRRNNHQAGWDGADNQ